MQTELLLLLFLCFCLDKRQVLCDDQLVYKLTNIECQENPDRGHLFARNGYLDTSLVPPFSIGIYQLSSVIVDKNSTISEHIGSVKFHMQSMLTVKSKKRPKP
ncbi:Hypothetical predicted protein [Drosophila guanche]|uniref:Uncharacterized protein n=1 Tax=Drosophila guanche TaxID=7266 RepID=A0A3B0JDM0_DROGU|nr:Hypothetical predicted protein [Drosophila guanche]